MKAVVMLSLCIFFFVGRSSSQARPNRSPEFHTVECENKDDCLYFDRGENDSIGGLPSNSADTKDIASIQSSKALLTGTLLKIRTSSFCQDYDWYIVAQVKEAANTVIYGPSDTGGGACVLVEGQTTLYLAIPTTVVWAEISGYDYNPPDIPGQPNRGFGVDPLHKKPAATLAASDCFNGSTPKPGVVAIAPNIQLCDLHTAPLLVRSYYHSAWFYNRITGPSVGYASLSYTPVVGNVGSLTYAYDVNGASTTRVGVGWLGGYLLFGKSATQKANIDALSTGVIYDIPIPRAEHLDDQDYRRTPFFRPARLQLATGIEEAPTTPHDTNTLQSVTFKLPVVLNLRKQPSSVSFLPVAAIESVQHVAMHRTDETFGQVRFIAGADASLRFPYQFTHALFGDKPMTIDYSYRNRWLKNPEPFSDYGQPGLIGNPMEVLTTGRQPYVRTSLIVPLTAFLQFKTTAQHGSLPPDFHALGWSVQIGITIANTSSVEH